MNELVRAINLPDLGARPAGIERLFGWNLLFWPLLIPALVYLGFWGQERYQEDVVKGGFWRMPDEEKLIFYMRMAEGTDVRVASETMLRFEELLLPIHDGAEMRATVFGNQAYMEVEFDDQLLRTGVPLLYRSRLVQLADATGGTTIYIAGFDETPYQGRRHGLGAQLPGQDHRLQLEAPDRDRRDDAG